MGPERGRAGGRRAGRGARRRRPAVQPQRHAARGRARRLLPRHRDAAGHGAVAVRYRHAAGTARDLRERLGLDSGYLSRLLRRLDAGDLAAGADRLRPPSGAFVVATCDGAPVACGGVQALDDGAGEIKRMWVHPAWRGAGLGSRLLRHIEGVCRDLGHDVVRLDTNGSLTEALAMYERAGYRHVGRYNDNPYAEHFFAKRLAGASDVGR
ncbi:GNAT family N-acetyltransferase [Isoptericola cucumis]|uniref:GNAT family N-acetyltransferase n=1 Tax=Isoptericola cucumis TaxID=1776856 RepID=UPI00227B0CFB|nr:GNAT family N-acetyltransferase [Isoptericola cucumis]